MQSNRLGGLAASDTTPAQHRRDVEEVRAYFAKHPNASLMDVVMCCNMGIKQARIIRKEIRAESTRIA